MTDTIRDRRGAIKKIVAQITADGTMPVRTDWRTRQRAEDAGLFHFDAKRGKYMPGPAPKIIEPTGARERHDVYGNRRDLGN